MKASKLFAQKSFLRTCITYFLLCSLLVLAVTTACNALAAARLDRAFPTIDRLLAYEDALQEDDFAAIPMRRLEGCAYLVFDGNDQLLYASDNRMKEASPWRGPVDDRHLGLQPVLYGLRDLGLKPASGMLTSHCTATRRIPGWMNSSTTALWTKICISSRARCSPGSTG